MASLLLLLFFVLICVGLVLRQDLVPARASPGAALLPSVPESPAAALAALPGDAWRGAWLAGSLVLGLCVAGMTELLSAFDLLTREALGWGWGVAVVAAALWCGAAARQRKPPRFVLPFPLASFDSLLLLGVAGIVSVTAVIALVAAPNNFDSMTFHLARVQNWIQDRSLEFYPTNHQPQLYEPPGAEFMVMHLQLLSGGDRFANLVQWFSMLSSLVGVSLIAKNLGLGARGQLLSVVVAATIPMGILQSTSTQTDYVGTLWLVCLVYYLTRMLPRAHVERAPLLGAAAALGLGILTKGTTYFYAPPFLLWFGLSRWRQSRREAVGAALVILSVALLLNAGHYDRVFGLYGSPLASGDLRYDNETFSLSVLLSNLVRNAALHAQTPVAHVNLAIEDGVQAMHALIGIGINDPRTTWYNSRFHVSGPSLHEDFAGNLAHLALIAACLALFVWRRPKLRGFGTYAAALGAGFVLFCFYFKWQPYNSRLHLPLFVLWAPVAGAVLVQACRPRVANAVALALLLLALPWLLLNSLRPLLGSGSILNTMRTEQYFRARPELQAPELGAAAFVQARACADVGLKLEPNEWEYPLWMLLRAGAATPLRIEHIAVANLSAARAGAGTVPAFSPCAIIALESQSSESLTTEFGTYLNAWAQSPVTVYVRQ